MSPPALARTLTVRGAQSAVAVIEITGDPSAARDALGIEPPPAGGVGLRRIEGVDTLLVIRPAEDTLLLTPHGGAEVLRELEAALARGGIKPATAAAWPEASDQVEARVLAALGGVRGSYAVGVLLAQPTRWAAGVAEVPPGVARRLARLLRPPLVVATGSSNVGKSTLANAIAGREVARVADRPGVTRDAVAFEAEIGGLAVRYLDAPGRDASADEVLAGAQTLAEAAIAAADLVLWCDDARAPPPRIPPLDALVLRVALRLDLAAEGRPAWADVAVSALRGDGLGSLAAQIFEALVGRAAVEHPGAWAFWRS
ncbi:MAG: GTPase [Planctomycetota bacterium]